MLGPSHTEGKERLLGVICVSQGKWARAGHRSLDCGRIHRFDSVGGPKYSFSEILRSSWRLSYLRLSSSSSSSSTSLSYLLSILTVVGEGLFSPVASGPVGPVCSLWVKQHQGWFLPPLIILGTTAHRLTRYCVSLAHGPRAYYRKLSLAEALKSHQREHRVYHGALCCKRTDGCSVCGPGQMYVLL